MQTSIAFTFYHSKTSLSKRYFRNEAGEVCSESPPIANG